MDRQEAVKATNQGAIAALVSGSLTLLIMLIAMGTDSSDDSLGYFNDIWLLFDIFIIFLLAFFIWRKSRVAAVLMFVYFLASKIIIGLETGKVSGLFISALFLWFFFQATRGAFAWHKLEKAENPDYKTGKKWLLWLFGIFAVIIIGLVGLGLATTTSLAPATLVQTGEELPGKQREKLLEADIIQPDEAVRYYYSEGLFDVTYGGSIMTDKRIIGYWSEDDKPRKQVLAYDLTDIDRLQMTEEGGGLTDAVYQIAVRGDDESSLMLFLSVESERHLEMIGALEAQIAENEKRWAAEAD